MSILPALIAGLTSLIGAWLGATLTLKRFKNERAFDKRTEWYQAAHGALADMRRVCYPLAHALRDSGTSERTRKLLSEALEATSALAKAVDSAPFFAHRRTVLAIQNVNSAIERFAVAAHRTNETGQHDLTADAAEDLARELHLITQLLAKDVRTDLGLEPLPELLNLPVSR